MTQVLDHLRRSFPAQFDAEVLRRLGFAPNNESYIISIIRFLKLIDENGDRTDQAQRVFTLHDLSAFQSAFSEIVKSAYSDLFKLHGDSAWSLSDSLLITFFRQADKSSELVGTRQAKTYKVLAAYAGHILIDAKSKKPASQGNNKSTKAKKQKSESGSSKAAHKTIRTNSHGESNPERMDYSTTIGFSSSPERNLGLTVRIEINLPATGDQQTYDYIFKSIRENLLNG